MNHESHAECRHGQSKEEGLILEATSLVEDASCDKGPEARSNTVDVRDVDRLGHSQVRHDLQEAVVEWIPDVELQEENSSEDVGSEKCAILEQDPWKTCDWRHICFIETESDKEQSVKYYHADDHCWSPAIRLSGIQVEWQQEESQTSAEEQQQFKQIVFDDVVLDRWEEGASAVASCYETKLLCLPLMIHKNEERSGKQPS